MGHSTPVFDTLINQGQRQKQAAAITCRVLQRLAAAPTIISCSSSSSSSTELLASSLITWQCNRYAHLNHQQAAASSSKQQQDTSERYPAVSFATCSHGCNLEGVVASTDLRPPLLPVVIHAESVAVKADGSLALLDRYGSLFEATHSTKAPAGGSGWKLQQKPVARLGPGRPLGYHFDHQGNLIVCDSLKVGFCRTNPRAAVQCAYHSCVGRLVHQRTPTFGVMHGSNITWFQNQGAAACYCICFDSSECVSCCSAINLGVLLKTLN